jgi:hypothetical protein
MREATLAVRNGHNIVQRIGQAQRASETVQRARPAAIDCAFLDALAVKLAAQCGLPRFSSRGR